MKLSIQSTAEKLPSGREAIKAWAQEHANLSGNGWWTTGPMDGGLTDIAMLIPGLRIRVGSLASRNNDQALAIHFVFDGLGRLRPDEKAALKEIRARHGAGAIWHDDELHTLHLYAEFPKRCHDCATAVIDSLANRIRQLLDENVVRQLIRRSRWS